VLDHQRFIRRIRAKFVGGRVSTVVEDSDAGLNA
jgi:hypothetical protein